MIYAKIKSGSVEKYPYTIFDLKQDNSNVSFPKTLDDSILNAFGAYEVKTGDKPTYNKQTQTIVKKDIPELVDGVWTLKWETKERTQDEIDIIKSEAQLSIRQERNDLLNDCDWTIVSDSPLSTDMIAKWKTYRQELRDITKQSTFSEAVPSVTWPTEPS